MNSYEEFQKAFEVSVDNPLKSNGLQSLERGNKLDSNKPKISLIPSEAINEMAIAFTYGANKYGADNFKKGISYRRLIDATLRHILAFSASEDKDLESGNSHVGHALASLAMLTYMIKNKPELDDRYKGEFK